jgi:hypothetical protein
VVSNNARNRHTADVLAIRLTTTARHRRAGAPGGRAGGAISSLVSLGIKGGQPSRSLTFPRV